MSADGPRDLSGDGVLEAQAAFRALVAGLARPGTVARLPAAPEAPAGVTPRLLQVALVLLDGGVTFSAPGDGALARHVGLLTGSRPVRPEDAAFLLASGSGPVPELDALPVGTAECPEDGATMVLAVRGLSEHRQEAVPVDEAARTTFELVLSDATRGAAATSSARATSSTCSNRRETWRRWSRRRCAARPSSPIRRSGAPCAARATATARS